jgi:2-methylcitrate dehydratase PrpD
MQGASPRGATRELADFVANLRFAHLPDGVVRQACDIVLDTVGCAISAWQEDPEKARIAVELAGAYGASPTAAVLGGKGFRTEASLAALANGILSNAADYDDTHKRALTHTGSVVVPTALALAQERNLSGPDLLTALVAGYEVAVRVGMAVMPSHYRFWHSTATNGTFGAAACAAAALKLDASRTQMALGFAGTQAAGLNTFFDYGDFTKSLHPGKAAFNGILAARLAHLNASSPPTILEHDKGYVRAFSAEPNLPALTEGLGTEWEILQNGFKFFPSILASHSPIQATLALVKGHDIRPAAIVRMTNETYNTVKSHFSNKTIDTAMAARVSVPYCIAVAAVDREVGQRQFSMGRIQDPVVRQVLDRTEVVADPELNSLYPGKFPARVTITLEDGRRLQEVRYFPKGDPQDPLSPQEIEEKFRKNVEHLYSEAETRRVIRLIRGLPEAKHIDELGAVLDK